MRKGNRKKGVGCRNFETTEGLRTGSPAGDVDSHNIVCSWCAQAHVSIHECVLQTDIFKGKKSIESKASQKMELQAEKCWPRVFPSTVQMMQDEDCGFD